MLFVERVVIVVCTVDLIFNGQRLCKPVGREFKSPSGTSKIGHNLQFFKGANLGQRCLSF